MLPTENNEFDVQKTILKRKGNKNRKFFVEYNKLTNKVLSITPEKLDASNFENSILEIEENDLIREIFNNKISLHKLKIKFDHETNTRILIKQNLLHKWEFNYVKNDNSSENFIFLQGDCVLKKITAKFVNENFLKSHSKEIVSEEHLRDLPNYLDVYVVHRHDPSKLFDTLTLDIKKLFSEGEQSFNCFWLPNDAALFDELNFIHYNHGIKLTSGSSEAEANNQSNYKPNLVYKQQDNKILMQSIMESTVNFRLDSSITFYMYDMSDPGVILDTVILNTAKLNDFNLVEFPINTTKQVKIISNYSHIHLEDSRVSSYYKF